jgi:hypothetical protein
VGIVLAAAGVAVEQAAADIGELGDGGVVGVFELDQAAAPAPVAEAFPLGIRHFFQ